MPEYWHNFTLVKDWVTASVAGDKNIPLHQETPEFDIYLDS